VKEEPRYEPKLFGGDFEDMDEMPKAKPHVPLHYSIEK
jgi:hypothetical protein